MKNLFSFLLLLLFFAFVSYKNMVKQTNISYACFVCACASLLASVRVCVCVLPLTR